MSKVPAQGPTAQELVRQALDAGELARRTSDPHKRTALLQATGDLLDQAEKALTKQQGDKSILGT